jgi:nitrite transporter NirC
MPVTIPVALDEQQALAEAKAEQLRRTPARYLLSAMLGGAYVGVAILLLLMVSAPLVVSKSPFTKLVQGSVFGIALTLIVFAGAELFTGNNMVMLQGSLTRRVGWRDTIGVWVASLVGNLAGSVLFAVAVNASGVVTAGSVGGKPTAFKSALASIAASKDSLHGGQLFFRAVLCNFLVCLALWMAARTTSDAAKILCLSWALLAFIASGFEHSVANMTALSLAALIGVAKWSVLWRNLAFTVPGNLVGGALLVGGVYGWLGAAVPTAPSAGIITRLGSRLPRVRLEVKRSGLAPNGLSSLSLLPAAEAAEAGVPASPPPVPSPSLSASPASAVATVATAPAAPRRRASAAASNGTSTRRRTTTPPPTATHGAPPRTRAK